MTQNKKALTAGELFDKVNSILKEKGVLPDILDYGLSDGPDSPRILTSDWHCYGVVDFGGSEGIYLDLWIIGLPEENTGGKKRVNLGTYKTLRDDIDAYKAMGALNAEFIFALKEYYIQHYKEYARKGFDIGFYDGDKLCCGLVAEHIETREEAEKYTKELFSNKNYSNFNKAVIQSNMTGEEMTVYNTSE